MSTESIEGISDADGHLQVAAERAAESKPTISDEDDDDFLDELVKDDTPSRVRQGLWIGSLEAARNYPHLRSQNITHVLQVAPSPPPAVSPCTLPRQAGSTSHTPHVTPSCLHISTSASGADRVGSDS